MEKTNGGLFERHFKLSERGTSVRTEIFAGITTFMTVAYLVAVIPANLGAVGMPKEAVFTATVVTSLLATALIGIIGNFPFCLAPSMGLNSFFAFSVVLGMGHSWQFALTASIISAVLLLLMTVFKIREALFDVIPSNLKKAIIVGIGLFVTFIGLRNAGIIVPGGAILMLGSLRTPAVALALVGVVIAAVLSFKNVKGAMLIGIVVTTLLGIPIGVTQLPASIFSMPPSMAPTAFKFVSMSEIMSADMALSVLTFLFVAVFDTIGALVGLCSKAGLLDENEKLPNINRAYFADSIGDIIASCFGTSFLGTTVESAAGIAEGGKTGLTALAASTLFLVALFLSPLFLIIPTAATSPALITVGLLMLTCIKDIDFFPFSEGVPAFLTLILMPLSYSIADGIMVGILAYSVINFCCGNFKKISGVMYILSALFILRIVFM